MTSVFIYHIICAVKREKIKERKKPMTLDEVKNSFVEYVRKERKNCYMFSDKDCGKLDFDGDRPLFNVDLIFKEFLGTTVFAVFAYNTIDKQDEHRLEDFISQFIHKIDIWQSSPIHTKVLKNNGVDYAICKFGNFALNEPTKTAIEH